MSQSRFGKKAPKHALRKYWNRIAETGFVRSGVAMQARHSWHLPALEATKVNYANTDDYVQSHEDDGAFLDSEKARLATHPYLETVFSGGSDEPVVPTAHSEVAFRSDFECGNLLRADLMHFFPGHRVGDPVNYALWMKPDPVEPGTAIETERPLTQWFFFHVAALKPHTTYRFHIVNFCKRASLHEQGMRPVVCKDVSSGAGEGEAQDSKKSLWRRMGEHTAYRSTAELGFLPEEEALGLYCYSFTLSTSSETGDRLYVAMSQPYSFSHLQEMLSALPATPHLRRACLCLTPAGRHVDLVTVTEGGDELKDALDSSAYDKAKQAVMLPKVSEEQEKEEDEKEEEEDDASADEPQQTKKPVATRRQYKPVLFICARAVAGDAPASFIVDGIISWLASRDGAAATLRAAFVIMVVPMLNPDGCCLGNARTDAAGRDFTSAWRNPNKETEPSIYHTKRLLRRLISQGRLAACIEVSAHSRKTGSFFYGMQVPDAEAAQKVPTKPQVILAKRHIPGAGTNSQGLPLQLLGPLPALIPACMQWDFLLAFMYRAPFLMDHRSCSFEAADLLCAPPAPKKKVKSRLTETIPVTALSDLPLSLRQALFRYDSCPTLVFTYFVSFFKGSKGAQHRRHLHPGDYRNTGHALLLALAQSLKVSVHRNNRESYIALNQHANVGGSQAAHFAMDREFAVLERALCAGHGSLRGRHSSQVIARSVQLRGHDMPRMDEDSCVDLDRWAAEQEAKRALRRAAGWSDLPLHMQRAAGMQLSPLSSDEEDEEDGENGSEDDSDDECEGGAKERLFCSQCKVFDHEYGPNCPKYKPPPPPKKRIDEEYYVTDDFYQSVVRRYLKPSTESARDALLRWGTGKPYTPNYATTKRPPTMTRKVRDATVPVGPSLSKLMAEDERKWLATHAPLPQHSGILSSRKFVQQLQQVAITHDAFSRENSKTSEPAPEPATEEPVLLPIPSAVWSSSTDRPQPPTAEGVATASVDQPDQPELVSASSARIANVFRQILPSNPAPSHRSRPRRAFKGSDCVPAALVWQAAELQQHLAPARRVVRVPNSPRPSAS